MGEGRSPESEIYYDHFALAFTENHGIFKPMKGSSLGD